MLSDFQYCIQLMLKNQANIKTHSKNFNDKYHDFHCSATKHLEPSVSCEVNVCCLACKDALKAICRVGVAYIAQVRSLHSPTFAFSGNVPGTTFRQNAKVAQAQLAFARKF